MFFLLDMPFQTRKGEGIYYWCLVLHMHKLGYFYLLEGRSLTADIANYINKGRYSNNPDKSIAPSIETINNVLSLTLPVSIFRRPATLVRECPIAYIAEAKVVNGLSLTNTPLS